MTTATMMPTDGLEVFIWDKAPGGAPMRGYWVAGTLNKWSTECGFRTPDEVETWVPRTMAKAAPDLLDACDAIMAIDDDVGFVGVKGLGAALEKVRAAIKKAKGE